MRKSLKILAILLAPIFALSAIFTLPAFGQEFEYDDVELIADFNTVNLSSTDYCVLELGK